MARNKFYYSQSNHSVVVGNHIVTDFAEGDAISWEDVTPDKVAVMEGLDGARTSLRWAARTYLVAALSAIASLLYYIALINNRRD